LYDRLTNTEPSLSFVPNLRYRQALQYALSHLEYFQKLKNCNDIAQHAEELRLAANHISCITGKGMISIEEILSKIFSNFCIGK
ncbi:MAG: hypothetical protein OEY79_00915, partial [Anaplasmataceae bacterium]|nr:hypothetical protein [Anaplasmataceae bacterium]